MTKSAREEARSDALSWDIGQIEVAFKDAERSGLSSDIAFFAAIRANHFYGFSKVAEAEADLDHAVELAMIAEDDEALGTALGVRASILTERGDPNAEECFLRSIELLRRSGSESILALKLVHYGNLLSIHGRTAEALQRYEEAHELSKKCGSVLEQAKAIMGIGYAYLNAGEFHRAIETLSGCIKLLPIGQPNDSLFAVLYHIGVAYIELGDADSAEAFAKKANDLSQKSNKTYQIAASRNLFASILYLRHEYEHALEEFRLSRSLYLQTVKMFNAAQTRQSIGECLLALGRLDDGIAELQIAEEELLSLNEKNALVGTYHTLVDSYRLKGDFESALDYYQKQVVLQQEMFSVDFKTRLYLLDRKLSQERTDTEAKLYEMRAKQLENELMIKTMAHVAQTEIVVKFREELRHIIRTTYDSVQALKRIKDRLKELPNPKLDWLKFEEQFRNVHPEFRKKLHERFPDLTNQELRLCQLLRTGLKSHEAARLMCITERGVEQHRLRIRRKLGLHEKESLPEFLAKL